jgi:hypothetical protein
MDGDGNCWAAVRSSEGQGFIKTFKLLNAIGFNKLQDELYKSGKSADIINKCDRNEFEMLRAFAINEITIPNDTSTIACILYHGDWIDAMVLS